MTYENQEMAELSFEELSEVEGGVNTYRHGFEVAGVIASDDIEPIVYGLAGWAPVAS